MNIYEVWTHARGEEAIEAKEFVVTEECDLMFLGVANERAAAFSRGSWVSVRKIEK
jgi:hypothetical protein